MQLRYRPLMHQIEGIPRWARVPVALLAACFGLVACKKVSEVVVERGVKAAKDTVKGIEEGVEKGRKSGQSTDDALIVSRAEDLKGHGTISVRELRGAADGGTTSEVVLAIENTGARPLRITELDVLALDPGGFVKRPVSPVAEVTVPPMAKDQVVVTFDAKPDALAKVRLWGVEYPLRAK
jgi:hypothetical protein